MKPYYTSLWKGFSEVAPRRGAWIETFGGWDNDGNVKVAPRRGAWIETYMYGLIYVYCTSRPAGARGLKLATSILQLPKLPVAPRRGAWIETSFNFN